jgi:hypothetical protein
MMRHRQLPIERRRLESSSSISKELEAEDVLVVVPGREEGCLMPLRTRRR